MNGRSRDCENEYLLTVLTPSYNRSKYLPRVYASLLEQKSHDFLWMIVDDGSTDDTEQQVHYFMEENRIPIQYLKKKNGGKHTALNYGIAAIETPLTFIVDSDDYLTSDAIVTVLNCYKTWKEKDRENNGKNICGFTFLRQYEGGEINGRAFPYDGYKASYIESRVNARDTLGIDKAEVFYTDCLREFPFPEYRGERFLGEDVVWIRMARKYDMLHYNIPIYVGEYLEGGLTRNRRIHNFQSPKGCTIRAKEFMKKDIILRLRLRGTLQYLVYGHTAGKSWGHLIRKSPNKMLTTACLLPGILLYHLWNREYLSGK